MTKKNQTIVENGASSALMVNSVQKAFRVLTAFTHNEPRLTLTQIMDRLSIDKSTAQRFTHTLQVLGYLDKDPITKTLGITVKVVDLAHVYLSSNPLIAAATPYMVHLNVETGETVNLTVMDGTEVVFVARVPGKHLLSTGVIIGSRLPAYAAVTGLAMMSTMDEDEVQEVLRQSDLRPHTPATLYAPDQISERLKAARLKGYAMTVGDYFPNDISVGAPITGRSGDVLGAISLSVSIDRYTAKEAEAKFARLVSTAAKSISV